MMREDLVVEISMRTDVPIEDVEDVLEEQDIILEEERKSKGVKKCIIVCSVMLIFLMGALATLMVLDKKDKIDMEKLIKKYTAKLHD